MNAEINAEHEQTISLAMTAANDHKDPEEHTNANLPSSEVPMQAGGTFQVRFQINGFKPVYRDEYAGDELPHEMVRSPMTEGLC